MIDNHLFRNGMPLHFIPNWDNFLFFGSFSYDKNNGEKQGQKNRDENIPDLPNLTAYEDYNS
jgi:hypothetical protein